MSVAQNQSLDDGSLVVACFVVLCFGFVLLGLLLGFGCGLVSLLPSLCSVSYPSMMTWAHRPQGVCTRGKKPVNQLGLIGNLMDSLNQLGCIF